ncbi:MAG: UDP-N-acetylglucosamine 2-epimerase (non-hydrolyzing) [Bacteroidetes bacterium]|nr:UDP-N-acetylglucosamine 2-epimerase (non-hydrolyzing) [Bacteroidota bacterium]
MKKILIVVGTRPNFIKVTQFRKLAAAYPELEIKLAHTGQHSERNMSTVFFEQFDLEPDFFLNIDGKTPVSQMGQIMIALENLVKTTFCPDLIITPGDVNSTLAVAITANKLGIKLAHLESGLRSNDRQMPEEINRLLTDEISDYYFVTEQSGTANLKTENKKGTTYFVGNTMIDTMVAFDSKIDQSDVLNKLGLHSKFVLITMHRPATVDNREGLVKLSHLLQSICKKYQVVFPVHPRTLAKLKEFNLSENLMNLEGLIFTEPMGYFEFQKLIKCCSFVITDSGGIQEETTFRKVPCLTLRNSTERPVTVSLGTNTLVPFDIAEIERLIKDIELGTYKSGVIPEMWDGNSTARILAHCVQILSQP